MDPEKNDLHTWHKKLKAKHDSCSLTLEEATLICLLDIRNSMIDNALSLRDIVQSNGHVEGMVGSMDELLQTSFGPAYNGYQRGKLGSGAPPMQGHNVTEALTNGER